MSYQEVMDLLVNVNSNEDLTRAWNAMQAWMAANPGFSSESQPVKDFHTVYNRRYQTVMSGQGGGAGDTGGRGGVVAQPDVIPGAFAQYSALGEEEPFAAYLKRYELPGYGQSASQRWQTQQYDPTYGTYQASSYLNPETAPKDWTSYLANQGGLNPAASRQQAGQLFGQAAGQAPQEQRGFQEALGGDFGAFMANALRGRYAAPVAKRMAGWIPGMEQQFLGESLGSPEASFLSFLQNKLRL